MKNLIQDMASGLNASANILYGKFTLRQLLSFKLKIGVCETPEAA